MDYRQELQTSKELGDWYDAKYEQMGDGWFTPPDECNRHLDDLGVGEDRAARLLDVGCGAGHFLVEAQKRVSAVGIDLSAVGIRHCIARGVNAYRADIANLDPADGFRYDYIVSLGSLEHVVDLDKALDNIRQLLTPSGKFYFFCPNERWKHFDQPNERTMSEWEWRELFRKHGLYVHTIRTWNDSTAFIGDTTNASFELLTPRRLPPNGNKLNIGSGQRRFDNASGWINIDVTSRPPDQVPDLVCDVGREPLPYPDGSMDLAVLHQVYEHFGLGEGHGLCREIYRSLKPGGSLIITVPDMRALAERWISHQIEDYIYFVNMYGAYQGEPGDRHAWGYSKASLTKDMASLGIWSQIKPFDWRSIAGADIARDFWILGIEVVK